MHPRRSPRSVHPLLRSIDFIFDLNMTERMFGSRDVLPSRVQPFSITRDTRICRKTTTTTTAVKVHANPPPSATAWHVGAVGVGGVVGVVVVVVVVVVVANHVHTQAPPSPGLEYGRRVSRARKRGLLESCTI